MRVIIGCEESQVVCKAFRSIGIEAYSCDLKPCSGGHPEWHFQDDIFKVLKRETFDLGIFHPDCTYLTVTGNKWMKPEFAERFPDRQQQRQKAIVFFMKLYYCNIPKVAIENPVGIMSTVFSKPDQYVHPYYFGDPHSKKTGLWLRGLPKLKRTHFDVEPLMYTYKDGRKDPIWHVETMKLDPVERAMARSKTFEGFAKEMANQWGKQ